MKIIQTWLVAMMVIIGQSLYAQTLVSIHVDGACGMCSDRIEAGAKEVEGVLTANYDVDIHQLSVTVDEEVFDFLSLHQKMADIGHDTDKIKAEDDVYKNLHGCCQYRDLDHPHDVSHQVELEGGAIVSQDIEADPELEEEEISIFIKGYVFGSDNPDERFPLLGANVRWKGAPVGASTNKDGFFELGRIKATSTLVISFVGYKEVEVEAGEVNSVDVVMSDDVVLQTVEVKYRKKTSEVSYIKPIQTIKITEEELCKAACCSLSESFETSPSIDVSFTDAVTGTRQIQMLGLAGKYVQITRELIPDIRSMASIQGLTYTPGAWVEGIQLSKGAGSVVNGFESMTGQINVELRKPEKKEWFYLNLYGNEGGRYEANLSLKQKINRNWSTGFLLHGSSRAQRNDRNDDGFLDGPLKRDLIGVWRMKYQNANGWQGQFGLKVLDNAGSSGAYRYDSDLDEYSNQIWGASLSTKRNEVWTKIGRVISEDNNSSFGIQISALQHDQENVYGLRNHFVEQQSLFINLIYQSEFLNPQNMIKGGLSFLADDVDEIVADEEVRATEERIPGVFAEYTYMSSDENLTLVAGIRGDNHNIYGMQVTPRLHIRYALGEESVVRLIGGKGWRTPNIYTENPGIFATNRNIDVLGSEEDHPYGLIPESSWNTGINWTKGMKIMGRTATLSLDYYYTTFNDQVIADYDGQNDGTIYIYNQISLTKNHSAQVQMDLEPIEKFDLRLAYRFNQAKAELGGEERILQLAPVHRAFANMAYEANDGWHFDLTINWKGPQRIPGTDWMRSENRLETESPSYVLVNSQIRKLFNEQFELYLGAENLFNYRQDNPIVSVNDPFDDDFDASLVWGPIFGRNIYAGLRYRIE